MKKLLMFFAAASCTAFAQIEITGSDISSMFAIGKGVTIHNDDLISSVDIGSPGGGNSWNFTALQSNYTTELLSVDPLTSPYTADFDTADFCTYSQFTQSGRDYETWLYSTLNGYFDNLGSVQTNSGSPGEITLLRYFPARHIFVNPTTFNTQFIGGYTSALYINGTIVNNTSVTLNSIVDSYGTMTLPGGASYDALRLREQFTFNGVIAYVSYSFITKSGAQVNVRAAETNPPNSGTIIVNRTSYNSPLTTSVEQISELPEEFSLSQNYPNPFNPTTNIEFRIADREFVSLKVYDLLGNEVATLVNQEKPAGNYKVNFIAEGLTSGIYFYELRTGYFVKTRKMTLIK
jgi:hypothetical protein